MKIKPKFKLSEKAELHVQKVCKKFKLRWAQFVKTKQVPNPDDLIGSIKSKGRQSDEARFELSRRLLDIDLKHRSQFNLPTGPKTYQQSVLLSCISVIEDVDPGSLNMGEFPDESAMHPKTGVDTADANTLSNASGDTNSMLDNPGFSVRSFQFLEPPAREGDLGTIGDYRITGTLGSGGMGTVFLAEDPGLQRNVAIKVLHENSSDNQQSQQRFLRECRAMAAIESEHVIRVYHVGQINGVVYVVMPVLKGETLGSRIRKGPIDRMEAFRIARETALGLSVAHQAGLVHRDIKPENIWLEGESATVKILDFGLVRGSNDSLKTIDGAILGTPRYMSPEQARGGKADASSDLFSVGTLLYEMLAGKPVFEGESLHSLLRAVAYCEFDRIDQHAPELPDDAKALVDELLSQDPEDRPASATVVANRLGTIIDQDRLVPEKTAATGSSSRRGTRKWWIAIALGFAFFAAALTAILVLKFRTKDGTVVVEIDGEVEISEIEIDGNRVSFETGEGNVEFNVDPGEHLLSLKTAEGTELSTNLTQEKLTINAGQNLKVQAFWKPDDVEFAETSARAEDAEKAKEDQTTEDRYHRAAKLVLEMGGWVTIKQNGKRKEIKAPSNLPTDAFTVAKVHLGSGIETISNSKLVVLSKLSELESIIAWHSNLTDDGLAAMTDEGRIPFPKLRQIDFAGCEGVTGKGIEYFKNSPISYFGVVLTGVDELDFEIAFRDRFGFFANIELVEWMCDNRLGVLKRAGSLSATSYGERNDGSIRHPMTLELLKKIPDITNLHFTLPDDPEQCALILNSLSSRKKLKGVSLDGTTIVDWDRLGEATKDSDLEFMAIVNLGVSKSRANDVSTLLRKMPHLEKLTLAGGEIAEDAFRNFEALELQTSIKEIRFDHIIGGFSIDSARELAETLPDCEVYWDAELLSQDSKID